MKLIKSKFIAVILIFLVLLDNSISVRNNFHNLRKYRKNKNLLKTKDNEITLNSENSFFNFMVGFLEEFSESEQKNTKWYECMPCEDIKKTPKKESYIDSLGRNNIVLSSIKSGINFINQNISGFCEKRKEVIDIIQAILSTDLKSMDEIFNQYYDDSDESNNSKPNLLTNSDKYESEDEAYLFYYALEIKRAKLPSWFINIPQKIAEKLSEKVSNAYNNLSKSITDVIDTIYQRIIKFGQILYRWVGNDIITRIINILECYSSLKEYSSTILENIKSSLNKINKLRNAALFGPYQFVIALSDLLIAMMCNSEELIKAIDFYDNASTKQGKTKYYFLGKANGRLFRLLSLSETVIPEDFSNMGNINISENTNKHGDLTENSNNHGNVDEKIYKKREIFNDETYNKNIIYYETSKTALDDVDRKLKKKAYK